MHLVCFVSVSRLWYNGEIMAYRDKFLVTLNICNRLCKFYKNFDGRATGIFAKLLERFFLVCRSKFSCAQLSTKMLFQTFCSACVQSKDCATPYTDNHSGTRSGVRPSFVISNIFVSNGFIL